MSAKIIVGDPASPLAVYQGDDVKTCTCVMYSALSGEELAIDQLLPVVYSAAYVRVRFVPAGSTGLRTADGYIFTVFPADIRPDAIPYGTPARLYDGDTLIGKFYFSKAARTSETHFSLTAVSGVGILDGQTHYGNIYTGQTFREVAQEIINGAFAFTCAEDVAAIPIFGWLPISTRRANLHQLLFATGVMLRKDASGEVYFCFPDTVTQINVPDSRIFYGGEVDYLTPATGADVTEHTFIALGSDEQVTLYDNTQSGEAAEDVFVSFQDAPIHDLQTTGTIEIRESGVNYAVVSGLGTLVGKKYTHVTRVLSKTVQSRATGQEKTATVSQATLVNATNSRNVLERVLSYYAFARRIRSDIVLTGEKPGDLIAFNNPYYEPESAFLAQMEISSSSFLRAACELITGYVPSGGGNNYTQSVVLTGEGEWVSPIDGRIKIAVIGAGCGATGGNCGGAADTFKMDYSNWGDNSGTYTIGRYDSSGVYSQYQDRMEAPGHDALILCPGGTTPGIGGTPGTPGEGGRILVVEITVTKGQKFVYKCGIGGIGGIGQHMVGALEGAEDVNVGFTIESSSAGTEGSDTTFGEYTSADGVRLRYGYLDVLTNTLYGSIGDDGQTGQAGYLGAATVDGVGNGPNPGQPGSGEWERDNGDGFPDSNKAFRLGGSGTGGAAYGAAGPKPSAIPEYVNTYGRPDSGAFGLAEGAGVKGAQPVKPLVPAAYGKGGQAGHGGGGGSCASAGESQFFGNWGGYNFYRPGGVGGPGSDGGDGAGGCIVISM